MAAAKDEKPTDRIRVKHNDTGHHSTIARRMFNPEAHTLLKTPAVDKSGRDVPPKYHVTKGGSPATATRKTAVPRTTTATSTRGETPAATSKEQ